MSNYAIELQGKMFTPDGRANVEDVNAHNREVEARELEHWATCPEQWQVYIVRKEDPKFRASPCDHHFEAWYMAETFLGTRLSKGRVAISKFRTNFSRNMVAIRFTGTNGAEYYGRYGADWSQLCRVRKVKSA